MARINVEGGERGVGAARKRSRRKWSVTEKLRIVQEAERPGTTVSEIARRHGAHTSMVTRWRAQHRAGELGAHGSVSGSAHLVPVRVMRDEPMSSRPAREPAPAGSIAGAGGIEVELSSGQRLLIRGTVDAATLRTVLRELARS